MSYATVGHCPKCGAPIYAESPWWGVTPPPSRHSCTCVPQQQYVITTTGTSDIKIPQQQPLDLGKFDGPTQLCFDFGL